MTRILVQRGSAGGSSSNPSRAGSSSARGEPQVCTSPQVLSSVKDEEIEEQELEQVVDELLVCCGTSDNKIVKSDDFLVENVNNDQSECLSDENGDSDKLVNEENVGSRESVKSLGGLRISERVPVESEGSSGDSAQQSGGSPQPPPPPVPPPKPLASNSNSRRSFSGSSNAGRIGSSRRAVAWPVVSTRTSPSRSRPSSPRSHVESEGYNSADEQNPCFGSSYDDLERERQFEIDIRRAKGFEVKRMLEDGNCLFRAVADQVYGDSESYDLARQMCIDYMERERDHFSQFITEGFTSYCKRKRRDKVYGNNVEIQALSEMYNRPIHIYSYSTEPINIFHGSYNTDMPPIRLSYHHGNHYNSLVDPRRLTIGAGLGFSCLRGTNVDKDQVKAAIKAQQDQQIDNALLAEGRFYSDLELTEKEIECMVMEVSRAEYLANDKFNQQLPRKESSTSGAEPSSSGARSSCSESKVEGGRESSNIQDTVLSSGTQMVLSMGFSYLQVMEAYSIFGDDVDSMVCYLVETGSSSRRKGKATE
ncbi:OVARIAN TUMOR DOMAIN-containing deubiquitinating enzyme 6-like [Mangifera indica]|uniref:OVARIAN TUMOR DOMAIN-containing deubiquitinating enzyme 6-like n=1 Tax=Mangifera indica TaxID=29780 RepID=UPI001CF9F532|nr:OVARIAN TUMOR DOMAIN-containing deubiquitinating enzyme 6-like [Mangifera indica]XP_044506336.1 OVARIAN TUMOR DOMAIN-containing deubiquitinating enzyme 6-like [Mangifera indica]